MISSLKTRLRAHPFIVAGSIFCILAWILEFVVWSGLSVLDTVLSVLYLILVIGIAFVPMQASIALVIYAVIIFVCPQVIQGPTTFWGVWLALGVLGYMCKPAVSIPVCVITALSTTVQDLIKTHALSSSDITFACSFLLAGFIGIILRRNHEVNQLRASLEQEKIIRMRQQQDLQLLKKLHDDVGGTLTYALMLCRNGQGNGSAVQLHTTLNSVEQELTQGLSDLRSNVLAPLSADVETLTQSAEQSETNAGARSASERRDAEREQSQSLQEQQEPAYIAPTARDLAKLIAMQRQRLAAVGFDGVITSQGSPSERQISIAMQVLTEICNNILKHGTAVYQVTLQFDESGAMRVSSTNQALPEQGSSDGHGMELLRSVVQGYGGTVESELDLDEWSVSIDIPA